MWFQNEEDCPATAQHEERGTSGQVWARLCDAHHNELEAALASLDIRRITGSWLRAQGGPKAATRRMMAKFDLGSLLVAARRRPR